MIKKVPKADKDVTAENKYVCKGNKEVKIPVLKPSSAPEKKSDFVAENRKISKADKEVKVPATKHKLYLKKNKIVIQTLGVENFMINMKLRIRFHLRKPKRHLMI